MSGDQPRTPCGAAWRKPTIRFASPAAKGFGAASTRSIAMLTGLSKRPASERTSDSSFAAAALSSASRAGSAQPEAKPSRAMALRLLPPSSVAGAKPKASASETARARTLRAFTRPSWMSQPECPPRRPVTEMRYGEAPAAGATRATFVAARVSTPPAQPT